MELMKAIAMRQSTRSYQSTPISVEALTTILHAGCAAPVGKGDYDSVHITVIQNPDLLGRIEKYTAALFGREKANALYGAPTLVLISSKPNEQLPHAEIANAACIIENMALTATHLLIGSVYLWGIIYAFHTYPELLKDLNLPQGFIPVSGIALGYPTKPFRTEQQLKQTIALNIIK